MKLQERARDFKILEEVKVDLVLCDVTMDEMDGFSFCHKVRENENYRAVPFIFVTAKTSQEDKNRALEAGGDDIITKPFDINDLLIKVKALLRRSDIYKIYGAKKNFEQSLNQTAASRIVLIDDDTSMARLFQYNLIKSGFECLIAEGAEEGMKLIKSNPPDIIISDIMMPNDDGYELLKYIKNNPATESVPLIFLTAKAEFQEIQKGLEYGADQYLLKPFRMKDLITAVEIQLTNKNKVGDKFISLN